MTLTVLEAWSAVYTRSFPDIGCAPGSAGAGISVPCGEELAFNPTAALGTGPGWEVMDSCVPVVAHPAIDAYTTAATNARAELDFACMLAPRGHVAAADNRVESCLLRLAATPHGVRGCDRD
jgi:hypothetical protein